MRSLADRLRLVRVCCGNWSRVCDSPTVLTRLGTTGVLLDPPYDDSFRSKDLYSTESGTAALECRMWCKKWGDNPSIRIALCGIEGEGHEELEGLGWEVLGWKSSGYHNRTAEGQERRDKERIWFSPSCLRERSLFD